MTQGNVIVAPMRRPLRLFPFQCSLFKIDVCERQRPARSFPTSPSALHLRQRIARHFNRGLLRNFAKP